MWQPPISFLKELARFTISYISPPLVRVSNIEFGSLPDFNGMQGMSCGLQFINETEKAVLVRSITIRCGGKSAEILETLSYRVATQRGMAVASLQHDQSAFPPFKIPGMEVITRYAMFRFNLPVDTNKLPLHFTLVVEYVGRKSQTATFDVAKL